MNSTLQTQAAMTASLNARSSSTSASLLPLQIRSTPSSNSRTGLTLRRPYSIDQHLFKYHHASLTPKSSISYKSLNLVMEWQDCKVKVEIDVPASVAYECYSDRESMPKWSPYISSVKILEDQPDVTQMCVKYNILGQDLEFTVLTRNLQPIPNQKIHWLSNEGISSRGAVRFYPKGSSACVMELTISYEVPLILIPVASVLRPFSQGLLLKGLENFARYVKDYQPASSPSPTADLTQ